jgi:UDP-GlcNAc:undecaprenyl-phosphate GlcNAc-1-phosphate transferase
MVPVLVLGIPLFDVAMVFVSRFRRGVSLLKGGVDHCSHRLARMGLGTLGATLTLDLIGGALGMTAVFVMQANILEGYALGTIVALIACYVLWELEWRISPALRVGTEGSRQEEADAGSARQQAE